MTYQEMWDNHIGKVYNYITYDSTLGYRVWEHKPINRNIGWIEGRQGQGDFLKFNLMESRIIQPALHRIGKENLAKAQRPSSFSELAEGDIVLLNSFANALEIESIGPLSGVVSLYDPYWREKCSATTIHKPLSELKEQLIEVNRIPNPFQKPKPSALKRESNNVEPVSKDAFDILKEMCR